MEKFTMQHTDFQQWKDFLTFQSVKFETKSHTHCYEIVTGTYQDCVTIAFNNKGKFLMMGFKNDS